VATLGWYVHTVRYYIYARVYRETLEHVLTTLHSRVG